MKKSTLTAFFFICISNLIISASAKAQCADPTGLSIDNITENSITFHWTAVSGATGYQYGVTSSTSTAALPGAPTDSTGSTTLTSTTVTFAFSDPNYNATRYVHVRTTCSGGLFSNWVSLCKATPNSLGGSGTGCPNLNNFTVNAGIPMTLQSQTYTWIQNNSLAVKGPLTGNGTNQSYTNALNTTTQGNYKVTTDAPGCLSTDFGNVTINVLTPPTGLSVGYNSSSSVSFLWNAVAGANGYLYAVDQDPDNPDNTGSPVNSTLSLTASVNSLNPAEGYYIHVRGDESDFGPVGGDCSSVWSTVAFATGVLPINLEYFMGRKSGDDNYISWKVNCSGSSFSVFEVQRSSNGISFSNLQSISAGQHSCDQPFSFTDNHPLSGVNYYRIKISESTGHISYSLVLKISNGKNGPLLTVLPNPVKENSVIQLSLDQSSTVDLFITDINGRTVLAPLKHMQLSNGLHQFALPSASLTAGLYLCKLVVNGKDVQIVKLVKQ